MLSVHLKLLFSGSKATASLTYYQNCVIHYGKKHRLNTLIHLFFQQMTFYFGYKNVELLFAGLVINTPGGKMVFF